MKTFWRWTGTIFFALVFAFLVITGIGTSLPIWHSAKCVTQIPAPVDALFKAIADDGSSAAWRPELRSVSLVSGSGPTAVWQETFKNGQVLTLRTVSYRRGVQASTRHRFLAREIPFDPRAGFDGLWQFDVDASAPPGGSSVAMINEQSHIYNPVFRVLTKYVFGYTGSIRIYLTDLAGKFGKTPSISCVQSP